MIEPKVAEDRGHLNKPIDRGGAKGQREPSSRFHWTRVQVVGRSNSNQIPSTRIIFVFAVRCRILRGSRYSSQFSHSLARCIESNSSTTMRFGFQSPSSTSVLPPRTMYFPPYFATVVPARFLYPS